MAQGRSTTLTARKDDSAAQTKRSSRNRERELIEAAARIFYEKGYEATSIQEVAEALGMLKGSVYYYIESKEDLLFSVIKEVHEGAFKNLEQLRALEGPVLSKVRALIKQHVVYNARNLKKVAVFFHDFRSLSEERRRFIIAERDMYERFLRDLITQGQKEGSIRTGLDPKIVAIGILGMMNWLYHWYKPRGPDSPDHIADVYADLVVEGLAPSSSSEGQHKPRSRRSAQRGNSRRSKGSRTESA